MGWRRRMASWPTSPARSRPCQNRILRVVSIASCKTLVPRSRISMFLPHPLHNNTTVLLRITLPFNHHYHLHDTTARRLLLLPLLPPGLPLPIQQRQRVCSLRLDSSAVRPPYNPRRPLPLLPCLLLIPSPLHPRCNHHHHPRRWPPDCVQRSTVRLADSQSQGNPSAPETAN